MEFIGIITVPIGSYECTIYGYMVWLSLVYSIVGTYLTHKVGKALINLNYEQQKYEADFRFAMMRVRENTESIAFYRGEKPELENFLTRFKIVIGNFRDIMTRQKILNGFTAGYGQLAILSFHYYWLHRVGLLKRYKWAGLCKYQMLLDRFKEQCHIL